METGKNDKGDKRYPLEAHVDGLPAFNGKVVGSRPTGRT
jgi:hypothetical protein